MSSDNPKHRAFLAFAGVGTGKDLPTNALAAGSSLRRAAAEEPTQMDLEAQVRADFAVLEAQAAALPGLNDLLAAYGGYDAAICQAEAYLAADQQTPVFATTDSAG